MVREGPSAVTVEVPADVTVEPSEERREIASLSFLSSQQTLFVGSEDVLESKFIEEVATEFTLSEAILERIVVEVGGTVGNIAEDLEPPPLEEEVRSKIRTKTSEEKVKIMEITFLDFLQDSVVPLVKYLNTKREKYIVRKESISYVELITNWTKLKRAVSVKREWDSATAMANEQAASSAAECATAKATLQEREDQLHEKEIECEVL